MPAPATLRDARLSALVMAWHLDGMSARAISARLQEQEGITISREGVRRHILARLPMLQGARQVAVLEAAMPSIAERAYRLQHLQRMLDECVAVLDQYGIVRDRRGRPQLGLIREIRELLHEAAVQTGQISTSGEAGSGTGVHVYNFVIPGPGGTGAEAANLIDGAARLIPLDAPSMAAASGTDDGGEGEDDASGAEDDGTDASEDDDDDDDDAA